MSLETVIYFSLQTKLNSTSLFPSEELGEATKALLDSLGNLAQEVSHIFSVRGGRPSIMTFLHPELDSESPFDMNVIKNVKSTLEASVTLKLLGLISLL